MHTKEVIIFVTGVAAGFAASLIVCKKIYGDKARKAIDEEIASYKEYADKKIEAYKNDAKKAEKKFEFFKEKEDNEKETEDKKDVKAGYINYSRTYAPPDEEEDDDDDVEEGIRKEEYKAKDVEGPFEISGEEFGEIPSFDEEHLLYYKDGILALEDDDNILEDKDVATALGDILDSSGFTYDESMPTIYIRNVRTSTDFEITKINSFYGS